MNTVESPIRALRGLLTVPAAARAERLAQWLDAQPDPDLAGRTLAEVLAFMEEAPYRSEGSIGDTAIICFLDAAKIRFPLDDAAEKCRDPQAQSQLWCHASTSALVTGELADLPYVYARKAVRANPANEAAWVAYGDGLRFDTTDFAGDVEGWIAEFKSGDLPAELPKRALAQARSIAAEAPESWNEPALARLTELERALVEQ